MRSSGACATGVSAFEGPFCATCGWGVGACAIASPRSEGCSPEPVLAPFLLKQKIPVLVGISNFLVATCNFTVMYNFPTWFQTVMLTSASEAGACRLVVWSAA